MSKSVIIDGIKYFSQQEVDTIRKETWEAARNAFKVQIPYGGYGYGDSQFKYPTLEDYLKSLQPLPETYKSLTATGIEVRQTYPYTRVPDNPPSTSTKYKDWEIVSYKGEATGFIYTLVNNEWMPDKKSYVPFPNNKEGIENSGTKIHSVRRLKDNCVFTVGDKVNYGTIEKMIISWVGLEVQFTDGCGATLASIEKLPTPTPQEQDKPVLHISDDGKEMREGDYEAVVDAKTFELIELKSSKILNDEFRKDNKIFSTKESAEQYILENKPCLSVKDTMDFLRLHFEVTGKWNPTHGEIKDALIEIVHQKNSEIHVQ